MNKAFIFDMDGVIINSEVAWLARSDEFLKHLFGSEISKKLGDMVGLTVDAVYDRAASYGFSMDMDEYYRIFDEESEKNYASANLSPNIDKLVEFLVSNDFKLGLVSSSRRNWIKIVFNRLSFSDKFESIISINDDKLKPKPAPDGYVQMMKKLESNPNSTIVIEDSNMGLKAAKSSGAFTIAYSENLVPGYKQTEPADAHARTMFEVLEIVKKWTANHR